MISAVDWLMSKFGTDFARNSKFHIRMTILCQLRDSVTPALVFSFSVKTIFKTHALIELSWDNPAFELSHGSAKSECHGNTTSEDSLFAYMTSMFFSLMCRLILIFCFKRRMLR